MRHSVILPDFMPVLIIRQRPEQATTESYRRLKQFEIINVRWRRKYHKYARNWYQVGLAIL
jgi:hypothetical protein